MSEPQALNEGEALELAEMPRGGSVYEAVSVPSGRTVVVRADGDGERVVIRAPGGEVELTVRLTREGPVLGVRAVSLELAAEALSVDVDRLSLKVRDAVSVEAMGDVEARVLGDCVTHVQGDSRLAAGTASVHAQRGDLRLESAEDVHVDGAAVRLNC